MLAEFKAIARKAAPRTPPQFHIVDLFCGAGGMAEGFRLAGSDAVLGVDCWAPAAETFRHNDPTATVLVGDISRASVLMLRGVHAWSLETRT